MRLTAFFAATCAAAFLAAPALAQAPEDFVFKPLSTPAQTDAVPLYAGTPPGSEGARQVEQWDDLFGMRFARNVTRPTITPFLPPPGKATGAAVIVAPGGAYLMLSMDSEGYLVARWLADHGIAAFVLKYRVDESPADTAAFKAMGDARFGAAAKAGADKAPPIRQPLAVADAQQALRLVRARAGEWGVDPSRVGMIGFSAGAMTVLEATLQARPGEAPAFVAPIYGPMTAVDVPAAAPPLFTALAANDPLFGRSGFGLVEAWQKAGKPVELHFYETGDHGFGMRRVGGTSDLWIDEFYAWMTARGLLEPKR